jgi:hypothetical protein
VPGKKKSEIRWRSCSTPFSVSGAIGTASEYLRFLLRPRKGNTGGNAGNVSHFESVVQELVFELLESGQDEKLLTRLFLFFEDMANSADPNVSRDLLGISILEPLVYRKASLRPAWRFMGPKTKEFAVLEAGQQGKQENLPPV